MLPGWASPCTEWPLAACVPVMVSMKTMWLRLLCSLAAVAPTERFPAVPFKLLLHLLVVEQNAACDTAILRSRPLALPPPPALIQALMSMMDLSGL